MSKKVLKPGISTTGEKIRFAMGDVGFNIMWGFVGSYLTYYFTDSVLMSASVIGTIMLLARLLDGASDILMGFIIERTSSRWGKARPWILWMIIPLIITFLMAFNVPSFLGETAKVIYIAVIYILLSAVTYTACNMAYITLFALFAPDSDDRNFAALFRSLFAMLTALVLNMISMPLLEGFGGGWILAIGSYDGSLAVQAQSALNAEIFLMIGIPFVLAVIQIVLLIFWDMDKVRPEMLKELEVKRNRSETK